MVNAAPAYVQAVTSSTAIVIFNPENKSLLEPVQVIVRVGLVLAVKLVVVPEESKAMAKRNGEAGVGNPAVVCIIGMNTRTELILLKN